MLEATPNAWAPQLQRNVAAARSMQYVKAELVRDLGRWRAALIVQLAMRKEPTARHTGSSVVALRGVAVASCCAVAPPVEEGELRVPVRGTLLRRAWACGRLSGQGSSKMGTRQPVSYSSSSASESEVGRELRLRPHGLRLVSGGRDEVGWVSCSVVVRRSAALLLLVLGLGGSVGVISMAW